MKRFFLAFGVAAIAVAPVPAAAQAPVPAPSSPSGLAYADLADLTLAAPVVVRATIGSTRRIDSKDSPGLAAGRARLLVTAAIEAALTAPGAVPASLSWLWDAPLDASGKPPRPKGQTVLAWLTAPAADGKTRLVAAAAQQPWTAASEATVKAIAAENNSGAVPVVTGVANGFRADGTVAGESESQFFLTTADRKPLTMVVTARPGEPRRVAVARGDVIDESAAPVRRNSLLQYRLACTLPAALPASAGGDDAALAADWAAGIAAIGPCGRTLPR